MYKRISIFGGGMVRVILALTVLASFNLIAIQLFMSGNFGPLVRILSIQQATLISSFIVIIMDIVIVYFMITFNVSSTQSDKEFNRLFHKYYNGKNFDEAFNKARNEWKKRMT